MPGPFANPTFADVDFGFDHDVDNDNYMSIVIHVGDQGTVTREQLTMFPGLDGSWSQFMGSGPKFVVWDMLTFYKSTAWQVALEQTLDARRGKKAWNMSYHGHSYDSAQLLEVARAETLPSLAGWAYGIHYLMIFRVLQP